MIKRKNHSKVFDMVEEELHAINKIKDTSLSISKYNKIRNRKTKYYKSSQTLDSIKRGLKDAADGRVIDFDPDMELL
jgi:hypothetical protein